MPKPKPGKYDHLLGALQPLPPEDPRRQDKINELKAAMTHDGTELARNYIELRRQKDDLKERLSDVQLQIDAYEQRLVESQEVQSGGWGDYGAKDNALRLPTGEVVRVQPEPTGKVVDKEAFRIWCVKNGYERQLQLWPSTMNALVKERLLAGEPEPDGCEAFVYNKIVLVKNGVE